MSPTKEKRKTRTVPEFLDNTPLLELSNFIKKLPKFKQAYWFNRLGGKRGMPDQTPKPTVFKLPPDIMMSFDNEGHMLARTRAFRRRKPPADNKYTKSTHSMKKARNK